MNITKKFKVTFKDTKYNAFYTFSRAKSGAFNYGNGSCVTIERTNDDWWELYDTRYDGLVMKDFTKWCIDWMDGYFRKDLDPKWEEVTEE